MTIDSVGQGAQGPAESLVGHQLADGWHVVRRLDRADSATGGAFSVPYLVEKHDNGIPVESGFLKALDFSVVVQMALPLADALQYVTRAYLFERDLVMRCANRQMRNVVIGLAAGEVSIDDPTANPLFQRVPYIIFERADGDVRTLMEAQSSFDAAWAFRILHGSAKGLRQLHQAGITHQDLKPSNVMACGLVAKLGDLGRASVQGENGLHDDIFFAGDLQYAPPELLYGEIHQDDKTRRRAGDAYQLGSMLVFMFTHVGMTALIEGELEQAFHWRVWPRTYRNVLPYVRDAYDRVLENIADHFPEGLKTKTLGVIRQLCDPDPLIRGVPTAAAGVRRYQMETYISHFDRLAKEAEQELRRAIRQ